ALSPAPLRPPRPIASPPAPPAETPSSSTRCPYPLTTRSRLTRFTRSHRLRRDAGHAGARDRADDVDDGAAHPGPGERDGQGRGVARVPVQVGARRPGAGA